MLLALPLAGCWTAPLFHNSVPAPRSLPHGGPLTTLSPERQSLMNSHRHRRWIISDLVGRGGGMDMENEKAEANVVRAERFELVDREGKVRVIFHRT